MKGSNSLSRRLQAVINKSVNHLHKNIYFLLIIVLLGIGLLALNSYFRSGEEFNSLTGRVVSLGEVGGGVRTEGSISFTTISNLVHYIN